MGAGPEQRSRFALSAITLLLSVCSPAQTPQRTTSLEFDIVGLRLAASPSTLTVPKNVATRIDTQLVLPQGAPPEAATAVHELTAGTAVAAELRGPSLPPVRIVVKAGESIPIPPLSLPGDYFLDHIRLERNGATVLDAVPAVVPIKVIAEVFVTGVTSRPLSLDEIRQRGVVIDQTNFRATNFQVAFNVDGVPFKIDVPVAVPTSDYLRFRPDREKALRDIAVVNQTLQRELVKLPRELNRPGINFAIAPLPFFPASAEEPAGNNFGPPPIAGLLMIPGNIAFLNQFFSVLVIVSNVAPDGTPLVLRDVNATLSLPRGLDPGDASDDPLRPANVQGVGPVGSVRVVQLGADGKLGTADDVDSIVPQQSGQGEFTVEGLIEGSHSLRIGIDAVLHGLPHGPVPLKGEAAGTVLVRNPKFSISLSQPRTIRKDEPFDLYATVTNTSQTPANLVSVTLDGRSISGARLRDGQLETITFETLAPGDSATARFALVSQLTGDVTFSSGHFGSGLTGRIQLRAGVGERDVPLAPNAIALPKTADHLPATLVAAAQRVLGQALSIATAPAEALPAAVRYVSRDTIVTRGLELASAGQRVEFGEPLSRVAADLLLDWSGEHEPDAGFDQLLRETKAGAAFFSELANVARQGPSLAVLDRQQSFAIAVAGRAPHMSAIVGSGAGPAPVRLTIVDGQGRASGRAASSLVREVPFVSVLPLEISDGPGSDFVIATRLGSERRIVQAIATGPGEIDLGVVVPRGAAGELVQWRYSGVKIEPGTVARVILEAAVPATAPALQLDTDGDGQPERTVAAAVVNISEGAPEVLAVRQLETSYYDHPGDLRDPATHGLLLGVLFSKPVTQESAQATQNYAMEANEIAGALLQPGGRLAYLYLRKPVGNLAPRTLAAAKITDERGHALAPVTFPIQTVLSQGARVFGTVRSADGQPVPGAILSLTVVFGQSGFHVTSILTDRKGAYDFEYVTRLGDRISLTAQHPVTLKFATLMSRIRAAGEQLLLHPTFLGRGTVRGTVQGADGTPVSGTRVVIIPSGANVDAIRTDTNQRGEFVATEVPVGPFTVRSHDAAGSVGIASGVLNSASEIAVIDVVLATKRTETARVVGRVFLSDGATAARAFRIYAGDFDRQRSLIHALDETVTDDEGGFTFSSLPSGGFDIVAVDPAAHQLALTHITAAPAVTTATSIVMSGSGRVRGTVLNAQGKPVSGAVVAGGTTLGVTDANGAFEIEGVPPGKQLIEAGDPQTNRRGSSQVTVVPDQTVTAFVTLEARATIAGRVLDANRKPVPGATVRIPSSDGFTFVFANNSGVFTFPDLPLGDYLLQAPGPSKEALIEYMKDQGMDPRTAFTSGDIPVNLGGQPEPVASDRDAVLRAYEAALQTFFSVPENRAVPPPPSPDGGFGWTRVKLLQDSVSQTADIVYLPQGTVSGTTVDSAGSPMAALVRVVAVKPSDNGGPTTSELGRLTTDASTGAFSFGGIPRFDLPTFQTTGIRAGDFTVEATSPLTRAIPRLRGQLNPNEPNVSNLVIRFPSATSDGTISGTVLMPDGLSPAPEGTSVAISFGTLKVSTDSQGRFQSRLPIPAGQYVLTAETVGGGLRGRGYATVPPGGNVDAAIRLLGPGSVVVTVRRTNGAPVPDADVELKRFDFPGDRAQGTTGPDGVVRFANITEGRFEVVATERVTGLRGRGSATIIRDVELPLAVALAPSGRVTGTFRAAGTAASVPNAEVVLTSASGVQAYASTDSAGRFELLAVPVGTFRVEAFDPLTARIGRGSGELRSEGEVRDVSVLQVPRGVVEGFALRADAVTPLQGVPVTIRTTGTIPSTIQTTTRDDGGFSFAGVPQGEFQLETRASGFTGKARGTLTFEGETVSRNVLLAPFGAVRVTVVDTNNQPVNNATVEISGPREGGSEQRNLRGNVDRTGAPAFELLPLGTYTVVARSLANEHDGGIGSVRITEPNQTAEVQVRLRGAGQVSVRVVASDGSTVVPSARVVLNARAATGTEHPRPFGGTFRATGESTIQGVPVGDFFVRAESGPLAGVSTGTIAAPGATVPITIVLGASGMIAGRVLLPDGKTPAAGAFVTLNFASQSSQSGVLQVTTDATGTFSFAGIPIGRFTVSALEVSSSGAATASGALSSDGETAQLGDQVLDNTAPRIVAVTPSDGATGVPVGSPVVLTFDERMLPSSFVSAAGDSRANVQLLDGSTRIQARVTISTDGRNVTISPSAALRSGGRYTVVVAGVPDGPKNVATLCLIDPFVSTFTVQDTIAPVVSSMTPEGGARRVAPDAVPRIVLSEPVAPGFSLTLTDASGRSVAGETAMVLGDTTLVFTPVQFLKANERYTLTLSNVTDTAGNPLGGGTVTSHFFTVDTIAPVIRSLQLQGPPRAGTEVSVVPDLAGDDVARVEFAVAGRDPVVVSAAPFAFRLALPTIAKTITVVATACDHDGNCSSPQSVLPINLLANQRPTVTLTNVSGVAVPASGQSMTFEVAAADDVALAEVILSTAGVFSQSVSIPVPDRSSKLTSQHAIRVPASTRANSTFIVQAAAIDTAGYRSEPATLKFSVRDTGRPAVTIAAPVNNARVLPGEPLKVVVSASDDVSLRSVGVSCQPAFTGCEARQLVHDPPTTTEEFTVLIPSSAPPGQVRLVVSATDSAGNTAPPVTRTVDVIDSVPPVLASLQLGIGGTAVPVGQTIDVRATATDNVAVTAVAFRVAASPFTSVPVTPSPGVQSNFPLTVPLSSSPGSTLEIAARATDAEGNLSDERTLLLTVTAAVSTNRAPYANAGQDQSPALGGTVQLDGRASTDPDGDSITYEWSLLSVPSFSKAALSDPTLPAPTFVADRPGAYLVQLVVRDRDLASAPDLVAITTRNTAPVANAGMDRTASVGQIVGLDGAASSDADGDQLRFHWSVVTLPAGSKAVLADADSIAPGLTPDVNGTYIIQLVVNDGRTNSAPDEIRIVTSNTPPVASAGPDQTSAVGRTVRLDGSRSSDVDGDPLQFTWSLLTRPAGSAAQLVNAATPAPSFVVDRPGTYELELAVTDTVSGISRDSVIVTAENSRPVARSGPDQTVQVGAQVQLDGSASTDVDGDALTYQWSVVATPSGSSATLSDPNSPGTTFLADRRGTYTIQLVVNDGVLSSAPDLIVITTRNSPPIANAGEDRTVRLSSEVLLDASGSSDPDVGDPLTYEWSILSRPPQSAASISSPASVRTSFVADRPGNYVIRLIVTDGLLASEFDTVTITTGNVGPTANAGPDQVVTLRSSVQLDGGGSSDANGDPLTYSWTLVAVPAASTARLTNASIVNPTFVADRFGVYVARLIVSDGTLSSSTDSVTIEVAPGQIGLNLVGTNLVGVGRSERVNITLTPPAPAGGVTVTLSSDDTSLITVGPPAAVLIAENAGTGQATVNGIAAGTVTVRASAAGYREGTLSMGGTPNLITVPASMAVAPGQVALLPISIAPGPAPAGGVAISVSSDNPDRITVLTPGVTIPQGARSVNASVQGSGVGTATVTATNPNYAAARVQITTAANLNIVEPALTFHSGLPADLTVRLESGGSPVAAPAPGLPVELTITDSGCVSTTSPLTIAAGLVNVTALLSYGGRTPLPCSATITARATDVSSDSITVTVNPTASINLLGFPTTLGAGLQDGPYSARLGTANHRGTTLTLRSSNPALQLSLDGNAAGSSSVDISIPAGSNNASFYIQALESAVVPLSAVVTATAPGFSAQEGTVAVVQPAVGLNGLNATTTSLSADTPFTVFIGVLRANSAVVTPQALRAGAQPLQATVTTENPSVARLVASGQTGNQVTVAIGPGQSASPSSVTQGGVALDPVGDGSTRVTAAIRGFTPANAASATVTVSTPIFTLFGLPPAIGAGLQDGPYTLRLGATNHGGTTVRLQSSDPSALRLSPNESTPGTAFIDIAIANGSNSATYYVQAPAEAPVPSSVTVTASAPGFAGATGVVNVVRPALALTGLSSAIASLSADRPFQVVVGTATSNNSVVTPQAVRAGGSALQATVTSSVPSVATFVTSGGAGASVAVRLLPGESRSPVTVTAGGVAFRAVGGGRTDVTAVIAGFAATSASTVAVTVSAPGMTFLGLPAAVGAGLQDGPYSVRLEASNHGGVTLRLRSSNPSVVRLSANANTPGADLIDIPVASGSTNATFFLHGIEGAPVPNNATITVSAPGFTEGTGTVNLVQPGLAVTGLQPAITSLSADRPFSIQAGIPVAGNSRVSPQSVRAGAAPVQVAVTNETSTAAQLVTRGQTGQSVTVGVAPGQSSSPSTVSAGGVALDPLGTGLTRVVAAAPGFVTTTAGQVLVTVSTPSITLFGLPATVGAGLQDGPYTVQLGASNHGGIVLRLQSSNPAYLRLSRSTGIPGSDFIDIPIADGAVQATYYIQGVARAPAPATVTLTASAAGFSTETGSISVVQPGIAIRQLPASIASSAADVPFIVTAGIPNASGYLAQAQTVAAGALAITVTATSNTVAVGRLVSSTSTGAAVTVEIVPGQSSSPASVGAGGVAFDPQTPGQTTVTLSAHGFRVLRDGTISIAVLQ